MYELSTLYPDISGIRPAYGWHAAYARTVDGLPYIGPHRNFPHHLFAFGDASRSVTGAYLASRILLRHHLEEPEAGDAPSSSHAMAVDLLAFGPHPDDIEIGLGGTVARHAALGFSVGLCDLTQGEMGSNGTIDERSKEAAAAAKVLGSALAREPALARSPDREGPGASRAGGRVHPPAPAPRHRGAVLVGSPSRSHRLQRAC